MSQKPISTDHIVQVFTVIDTASNGASHRSVPQLDRPKCSAISLGPCYNITQALFNWYQRFSAGLNWPGNETDNSAFSTEVTHE